MAAVIDVANYFLERVDRGAGDLITQLKLYKLVYYAQVWSLVIRLKPMFDEEIQAWLHGPVPVALWPTFQGYGDNPIPAPSDGSDSQKAFEQGELKILELVWDTYGELSAGRLRNLTHSEAPWLNARAGVKEGEPSQETINLDDMQSYYSNFALDGGDRISPEAALPNKEVYTVLEKNDGTQVRVRLSEMEGYILANIGNLKKEKVDIEELIISSSKQ